MTDAPRASRKRHQILQAAGQLFLEQGFGGASMDAIAAAAGVSKATVYAHFASKEQLFAEMVSAYCREQQAAVMEIEAEHPTVEEGLRRIALTIMQHVADARALAFGRMIIGEATRFPDLGRAFVEAGYLGLQNEVAGYLGRAAQRGGIRGHDCALAAELLISMARGAVQFRSLRAGGGAPDAAELDYLASGVGRLLAAALEVPASTPSS